MPPPFDVALPIIGVPSGNLKSQLTEAAPKISCSPSRQSFALKVYVPEFLALKVNAWPVDFWVYDCFVATKLFSASYISTTITSAPSLPTKPSATTEIVALPLSVADTIEGAATDAQAPRAGGVIAPSKSSETSNLNK